MSGTILRFPPACWTLIQLGGKYHNWVAIHACACTMHDATKFSGQTTEHAEQVDNVEMTPQMSKFLPESSEVERGNGASHPAYENSEYSVPRCALIHAKADLGTLKASNLIDLGCIYFPGRIQFELLWCEPTHSDASVKVGGTDLPGPDNAATCSRSGRNDAGHRVEKT